jgi:prepilin-type N-terminal cleavage/methylation domain-containing protein
MVDTRKTTYRGFSLVEMIVAMGVFSVVLILVVSVVVGVVGSLHKSIAVKDVLDNERFILELITKELRTGSDYRKVSTAPPGCPAATVGGLEFTSFNQAPSLKRLYFRQNDVIWRIAMTSPGNINCTTSPPEQLSSSDVVVDNMNFTVYGGTGGPNDGQPRVTVSIKMHSSDPKFGAKTSLNLQTTITQRTRDL